MIFALPVSIDYAPDRPPVVTNSLMGLNAAVWGLGVIFFWLNEGADPLIRLLGVIPAENRVYTWFTHQFVHGGPIHFLGNMAYLYLFGACVEDLVGRLGFAVFYLACGVLAALAQVLFTTELNLEIPLVGASGAIAGCMGAFMVQQPKTQVEIRYFGWFFAPFSGTFWISAWIMLGIWFALEFLHLLSSLRSVNATGGGVAFGAHVGGMLCGAVTMKLWPRSQPAENTAPMALKSRDFPQPGADPAEPASIMLYFADQEQGPFSLAKVRAMAGRRKVPPDAQYWQEGMPEWRPISELLNLGPP